MNMMSKFLLLGIGLLCASCCCQKSGLPQANQKVLETRTIDLTDGKEIQYK